MATTKKKVAKKKVTKKQTTKRKVSKQNPPSTGNELIPIEEHRRRLAQIDEDQMNMTELRRLEKKVKFLEGLAEFGTVAAAAEHAGIARSTYYMWTDPGHAKKYGLKEDKFDIEFRNLCNEALSNGFREKVLRTGYKRAIDGWVDEHYDRNGNLIKEEHKYDSSILQMLMKRVDPGFREKSAEINLNDNRSSTVTVNGNAVSALVTDDMTEEQQRLLIAFVEAGKKGNDEKVIEGEVIEDPED